MKCKHSPIGVIVHIRLWDGTSCNSLRSGCGSCDAWLSLGPSNDSPPEVALEIRAAELAHPDTIWSPEAIGGGYVHACWQPGAPFSDSLDDPEQFAGCLAGAIVEHGEGT